MATFAWNRLHHRAITEVVVAFFSPSGARWRSVLRGLAVERRQPQRCLRRAPGTPDLRVPLLKTASSTADESSQHHRERRARPFEIL